MELKGKYFDAVKQAQKTQRKYEGFGTGEILKTANNADQTDSETPCLTIARQTLSITFELALQ